MSAFFPCHRWYRWQIVSCSFLILSLTACQFNSSSSVSPQTSPSASPDVESRLTLDNATLEQSNTKGELLWKIQVGEATYSADQKTAQLRNVKGNIFQEGKLVLQISANKGEIYRDGENVFLKDNIIAVDPRNKAVIRSEEAEWQPQSGILSVRNPLRGSHEKLEVSAKEGTYDPRQQQLTVTGQIIATTKDPKLQLKTEQLVWKIPAKQVISEKALTLVRFNGNTITDELSANRALVQLNQNWVKIEQKVDYKSQDPPVQAVTDSLIWNYKNRFLTAPQPIRLVQYQENMTVTGNQGQVDLGNKIARLEGGVQGISQTNQTKLYANNMTWNITAKTLEATGNVIYEQNNPKFNLTGEKAVGILQDNSIVVNGNSSERVVTEIFP